MEWAEAAEAANKQGGTFLSLKEDGDSAKIAFVGKPEMEEVTWTGSAYEPYDPAVHSKASQRFKINVFNVDDECMQIWEMSKTTFGALAQVREDTDFDTQTFKVTRKGAKGDSKTTYLIMPIGTIDDVLKAKIANEQQHDLTRPRKTGDDLPF